MKLKVATPAEIKSRGHGMTLRAAIAESPFGDCLIADSPHGICHLSFFDEGGRDSAIAEMRAEWPLAQMLWNDKVAADLIRKVFTRAEGAAPPLELFVRATDFQHRVWRALLCVPSGTLVSYGGLAAAAGHPQATRATGTAVGSNPISFLIPCHRVIRANGDYGQYRWGAARKRAIIAWESAHAT
ncbi:MAG: methylated-DNA--[protein]-cysteine S-methyltransferase [Luteolibacter sp.]|nr:methylated-DNA--[protein]-cysteine S-methyltransferase [Luteolibacter sp.]